MVAVTKRRISCRRLAHPLLKQVSAPVRYRSTPRTQAASTTAFTRCECPQRVVDSTDIDATHYDPPRRKECCRYIDGRERTTPKRRRH